MSSCPHCDDLINYDYLYEEMDYQDGDFEINCPHCREEIVVQTEMVAEFHLSAPKDKS